MRPFIKLLSVLSLLTFCLFLFSNSSGASEIDNSPDLIWDVEGAWESGHTGRIRAMVFDFQELDGYMYTGGKFLNVVSPGRGTTYDQPFFARFDLVSGEWDSSFRPVLDGPVYAIDVRSDGYLVVGGELTGGIAAINPATGQLDPNFNPGITNSWGRPSIFDLDIEGDDIYAGGTFSKSQGVDLRRLAKFDATTGVIDPNWAPRTNFDSEVSRIGGENVFGLEVDPDRGRVYVVGKFGGIDDNMDAAYFATLNIVDGSVMTELPQGLPVGILSHRLGERGFSMWQHDVQYRGDRVYVGGQGHQTIVLNADDLSLAEDYTFFTNKGVGDASSGGDTQVIFLGKNTLWAGCHCWGSVGPYQIGSYSPPDIAQTYDEYVDFVVDFRTPGTPAAVGQQKVSGLYGIDLDTFTLLPTTFDLSGQAGAWALYEDSNGRVWAGGQYFSGGGRALSSIARFSPISDVVVEPTSCVATRNGNEVDITWEASGDPDRFIVRRSRNGGFNYWLGRTSGSDRSLVDSSGRSGVLTYSVESVVNNVVIQVACEDEIGEGPVPEGLRYTRVEKKRIVLNWQATETVEIERNGVIIGTDSDGWFTDAGLESGTEYSYRVRYIGSDNWSDSIVIETLAEVVVNVAPASCEWSLVGDRIEVTWPETGDEIIVRRMIDNSGEWFWRGRVPSSDELLSDRFAAGDLEYKIKARYPTGDSEYTICTP